MPVLPKVIMNLCVFPPRLYQTSLRWQIIYDGLVAAWLAASELHPHLAPAPTVSNIDRQRGEREGGRGANKPRARISKKASQMAIMQSVRKERYSLACPWLYPVLEAGGGPLETFFVSA